MGILGELITAENVTLAVAIWLAVRLEWTRSELRMLSQTVREQSWAVTWLREVVAHMAAKLGVERSFKPPYPPFQDRDPPI